MSIFNTTSFCGLGQPAHLILRLYLLSKVGPWFLELLCLDFGLNPVIMICLYTVATRPMGHVDHALCLGSTT